MSQENSTVFNQTEEENTKISDDGFKPMSEEEEKKQRRSRKLELIAGAIGDMGSALTNLIFTTKGAPTMIKTGKDKQLTLMERIYGRQKNEDTAYQKQKSVWEKEQERQRKEAEKAAKDNEVIEDIHPDFQPKVKNWEQKDYVDLLYEKLRTAIIDNAKSINSKKGIGVKRIDKHGTTFIPSSNSTVIDYLDGFNTDGNVGRYMKAELIRSILSGDYKNEELSEDWLDKFRKTAQEDHDNWIKYK